MATIKLTDANVINQLMKQNTPGLTFSGVPTQAIADYYQRQQAAIPKTIGDYDRGGGLGGALQGLVEGIADPFFRLGRVAHVGLTGLADQTEANKLQDYFFGQDSNLLEEGLKGALGVGSYLVPGVGAAGGLLNIGTRGLFGGALGALSQQNFLSGEFDPQKALQGALIGGAMGTGIGLAGKGINMAKSALAGRQAPAITDAIADTVGRGGSFYDRAMGGAAGANDNLLEIGLRGGLDDVGGAAALRGNITMGDDVAAQIQRLAGGGDEAAMAAAGGMQRPALLSQYFDDAQMAYRPTGAVSRSSAYAPNQFFRQDAIDDMLASGRGARLGDLIDDTRAPGVYGKIADTPVELGYASDFPRGAIGSTSGSGNIKLNMAGDPSQIPTTLAHESEHALTRNLGGRDWMSRANTDVLNRGGIDMSRWSQSPVEGAAMRNLAKRIDVDNIRPADLQQFIKQPGMNTALMPDDLARFTDAAALQRPAGVAQYFDDMQSFGGIADEVTARARSGFDDIGGALRGMSVEDLQMNHDILGKQAEQAFRAGNADALGRINAVRGRYGSELANRTGGDAFRAAGAGGDRISKLQAELADLDNLTRATADPITTDRLFSRMDDIKSELARRTGQTQGDDMLLRGLQMERTGQGLDRLGQGYDNVQFRKFPDGQVSAFMPDDQWLTAGSDDLITSYDLTGGHGGASREMLDELAIANPAEYAELAKNMNNTVGYKLPPQQMQGAAATDDLFRAGDITKPYGSTGNTALDKAIDTAPWGGAEKMAKARKLISKIDDISTLTPKGRNAYASIQLAGDKFRPVDFYVAANEKGIDLAAMLDDYNALGVNEKSKFAVDILNDLKGDRVSRLPQTTAAQRIMGGNVADDLAKMTTEKIRNNQGMIQQQIEMASRQGNTAAIERLNAMMDGYQQELLRRTDPMFRAAGTGGDDMLLKGLQMERAGQGLGAIDDRLGYQFSHGQIGADDLTSIQQRNIAQNLRSSADNLQNNWGNTGAAFDDNMLANQLDDARLGGQSFRAGAPEPAYGHGGELKLQLENNDANTYMRLAEDLKKSGGDLRKATTAVKKAWETGKRQGAYIPDILDESKVNFDEIAEEFLDDFEIPIKEGSAGVKGINVTKPASIKGAETINVSAPPEDFANAIVNRRPFKAGALTGATLDDGGYAVFSYDEPIYAVKDGKILTNLNEKFSTTTSRHQNILKDIGFIQRNAEDIGSANLANQGDDVFRAAGDARPDMFYQPPKNANLATDYDTLNFENIRSAAQQGRTNPMMIDMELENAQRAMDAGRLSSDDFVKIRRELLGYKGATPGTVELGRMEMQNIPLSKEGKFLTPSTDVDFRAASPTPAGDIDRLMAGAGQSDDMLSRGLGATDDTGRVAGAANQRKTIGDIIDKELDTVELKQWKKRLGTPKESQGGLTLFEDAKKFGLLDTADSVERAQEKVASYLAENSGVVSGEVERLAQQGVTTDLSKVYNQFEDLLARTTVEDARRPIEKAFKALQQGTGGQKIVPIDQAYAIKNQIAPFVKQNFGTGNVANETARNFNRVYGGLNESIESAFSRAGKVNFAEMNRGLNTAYRMQDFLDVAAGRNRGTTTLGVTDLLLGGLGTVGTGGLGGGAAMVAVNQAAKRGALDKLLVQGGRRVADALGNVPAPTMGLPNLSGLANIPGGQAAGNALRTAGRVATAVGSSPITPNVMGSVAARGSGGSVQGMNTEMPMGDMSVAGGAPAGGSSTISSLFGGGATGGAPMAGGGDMLSAGLSPLEAMAKFNDALGGTIETIPLAMQLAEAYGADIGMRSSGGLGAGGELTKEQVSAISGLESIDMLRKLAPDFGTRLGAQLGVPTTNPQLFTQARRNLGDVLARLRTGAAINEVEERLYLSEFMPAVLDTPETIQYKLDQWQSLLERVATKGASGTQEAEPMQQSSGGFLSSLY